MTLTLNHNEAIQYLASLEVTKVEEMVSRVQPEQDTPTKRADIKRIAAIQKLAKESTPAPKTHTPKSKRFRISDEHMGYIREIALKKCEAASSLDNFVGTYGYTKQYLSQLIGKTKGVRLVKGRDIPTTDKYPNTSPVPTQRYIRAM